MTAQEAGQIEHQKRGQTANEQWLQYHTCRITASNFGRVCHSTWFQHHDPSEVKSVVKDLLCPRRISTVAIEHGRRFEPEAKARYVKFQQQQGKHASFC